MKQTATRSAPQRHAAPPRRGVALTPPVSFASGATAPMTLQRSCSCEETGETCPHCAAKRISLQRLGTGVPPLGLPGAVSDVLRSPGQPMPPALRTRMEEKFGQDFSAVRLHADAPAQNSAAAVSARAYTVGRDIVFGRTAPDLASSAGQRLLGHELAHVVQQSRGGVAAGIDPSPALEAEAKGAGDAVASDVSADAGPISVAGRSPVALARDPISPGAPGETMYEVPFADGKKRVTKAEYEAMKARSAQHLRIDLKRVSDLANIGRQSQVDMLAEYHGGVESLSDVLRKPKALIGIGSDIWGKTSPPYLGMWSHPVHAAELGLRALERGDLREAAIMLQRANAHYRDAMHEWNGYREKTIG
ncbi:DUF4157 domain-containing protein, partial [Bradyrhizobium sp. ORS 375]|uniref:eCIS core domain-containing protein n=1 Tax=Bradyrhizobium sp. (strain ORS 375) TaxID=566679 RepID=UPI00191C0EE4